MNCKVSIARLSPQKVTSEQAHTALDYKMSAVLHFSFGAEQFLIHPSVMILGLSEFYKQSYLGLVHHGLPFCIHQLAWRKDDTQTLVPQELEERTLYTPYNSSHF